MKKCYSIFAVLIFFLSCTNTQTPSPINYQSIGGPCEGCEAILEFGDRALTQSDTLPDFHSRQDKIKISGTIYQSDGKTPAEDIILYIYHTDKDGLYTSESKAEGWAQRHGYNRGWIKTDKTGKYSFYTSMPGAYPTGTEPAHIHPIILEPNGNYYWLSAYFFENDPKLAEENHLSPTPRGMHSQLLSLKKEGEFMTGRMDLILGKNIPAYFKKHIFYLHGRIVELQGPEAVSEDFGKYEFYSIIKALQDSETLVHYHIRDEQTNFQDFCGKTSNEINQLVEEGVDPTDIAVIGASKGALMAMTISNMNTHLINYVLLGANNTQIEQENQWNLHGRVLGIYEKSDELAGKNYDHWIKRSTNAQAFDQLKINTGLGHGFLYRPLDDWLIPAKQWVDNQK